MRGLPLHEAMKAIVIVILESAKRLNSPELACTGARTRTLTVPILDPPITSTHLTHAHPPPTPPLSARSLTYGETPSSANSDNTTRSYQTLVNLQSRVLECSAGVLKITRPAFIGELTSFEEGHLAETDSPRRRQRRRKGEKTTIRHFQTERTILPLI